MQWRTGSLSWELSGLLSISLIVLPNSTWVGGWLRLKFAQDNKRLVETRHAKRPARGNSEEVRCHAISPHVVE